jgi:hypothetical protein
VLQSTAEGLGSSGIDSCLLRPLLLLLLLLLLQTGNPEIVADLYAPDGVLLPTVSNQVRLHVMGNDLVGWLFFREQSLLSR